MKTGTHSLCVLLLLGACSNSTTLVPAPPTDAGSAMQDAATAIPLDASVEDAAEPAEPEGLCRDGWCWVAPRPQGLGLSHVAVTGPSDVWIAGGSGDMTTLLHFDGVSWTEVPLPVPSGGLSHLWIASPGRPWVATASGDFYQRHDGRWLSEPRPASPCRRLTGTADDDLWCGFQHFDGVTWAETRPMTEVGLYEMWATGPGELWAVGTHGTVLRHSGGEWERIPSGRSEALKHVWGSGPEDVWILGDALLHWDGEEISTVLESAPEGLTIGYSSEESDAWVFGPETQLHWDGRAWSATEPPVQGLTALAGSGSDDVWAVGPAGAIVRWEGGAWVRVDVPAPTDEPLAMAHEGTANDLWLAGGDRVAHYDGERVEHMLCDGAAALMWVHPVGAGTVFAGGPRGVFRVDAEGCRFVDLEGVRNPVIWSSSPDDVWVFGPRTYRRRAGEWGEYPELTFAYVFGVHGAEPDDLWLIAQEEPDGPREIFRVDGSGAIEAVPIEADASNPVIGVWSFGGNDVWAVTFRGTVAHFDGEAFQTVDTAELDVRYLGSSYVGNLRPLAGGEDGTLYIAAHDGWLVRYDGDRWSKEQPMGPSHLTGLVVLPGDDVWVGTATGRILRRAR